MLEIQVKREGSLLPVELRREISQEQLDLVRRLLDATQDADDNTLEAIAFSLEMMIEMAERPPSNVLLGLVDAD